MDSEALKPCPFCGGEAKYYYYTPRDHNIECESCSNGTCLHETKAEAITAWNTRADDDRIEAAKAERDRLRELPDEVVKAAIDRANAMARQTTEEAFRIVAAALADALQETER